jgi:hypothetical protein
MSLKVSIAYVYPLNNVRKYFPAAMKFAETYQQFPAGYEHELFILCNGRDPSTNEMRIFDHVPAQIITYDNVGWDIGAFQKFADITDADLLVCFGAHIHFHRPGWLQVIAEAYLNYGPGLYGCAAYHTPNWHVRTTAFWFPPQLLRSYPDYVGSARASRYEFEHGNTSFTRHVLKLGFPCTVVTWNGCFPFDEINDHAPDFRGILVRDQHIHA